MPYATIADFERAYGQEELISLTNLDYPNATGGDVQVVEQAIADAEAECNGYLLAGGASLPVATPAPPVLRNLTLDIARYRLDRNNPREDVRQRYEDAIARLKDYARGLFDLGLDTGDDSADGSLPGYYSSGKTFTQDTLADYNFYPDRPIHF